MTSRRGFLGAVPLMLDAGRRITSFQTTPFEEARLNPFLRQEYLEQVARELESFEGDESIVYDDAAVNGEWQIQSLEEAVYMAHISDSRSVQHANNLLAMPGGLQLFMDVIGIPESDREAAAANINHPSLVDQFRQRYWLVHPDLGPQAWTYGQIVANFYEFGTGQLSPIFCYPTLFGDMMGFKPTPERIAGHLVHEKQHEKDHRDGIFIVPGLEITNETIISLDPYVHAFVMQSRAYRAAFDYLDGLPKDTEPNRNGQPEALVETADHAIRNLGVTETQIGTLDSFSQDVYETHRRHMTPTRNIMQGVIRTANRIG